ncbi:hypothetical protein E2542_SST17230 [Spatholobus suberectus]|nr:hypothetical protein E2542_SST17230 [Spatholobus suberectus]
MNNCTAKLHSHCGDQMLSRIFYGLKTVSKKCCHNLVHDVGKSCHDSLPRYILMMDRYFREKQAQIFQKSDLVWNDCNRPSFHLHEAKV